MRYDECLVITALTESSLTDTQVMLLGTKIFNWPLEEARQRFRDITSKCCISGGTLCVRVGDDVFVETGDRRACINEAFLSMTSEERAAELRAAKEKLLSR